MDQYLRLNTLRKMVDSRYTHIWDCCCDHGLLGLALMEDHLSAQVHFVDQVKPLITALTVKLKDEYAAYNWETHCVDLAQLVLPEDKYLLDQDTLGSDSNLKSKPKHLFIIAGVGGDLLIELVESILLKNPEHRIDFLLCPVRQNYRVRQALIQADMCLLNECLVREKSLFYEVLHVCKEKGMEISPVGSVMWDFSKDEHHQYLQRTLEHYQRSAQGDAETFAPIIQQYKALLDNVSHWA